MVAGNSAEVGIEKGEGYGLYGFTATGKKKFQQQGTRNREMPEMSAKRKTRRAILESWSLHLSASLLPLEICRYS